MLATFAYDNLGRRVSLTRGNGVVTTYAFDAASLLATLTQDLSGSGSDLVRTFDYNADAQIVEREGSNSAYNTPTPYNGTTAYTDNGLNQYNNVTQALPGYDARGNLTNLGTSTFAYDIFNRLTSATPAGASQTTFAYDALGRLRRTQTGSSVTQFLFDGVQTIAEYDGTTPTAVLQRRYVFGPGVNEPLVWYEGSGTSDRRWMVADERGSIIAVTNGSGAASSINAYDEYGVPASGNAGLFQYTGQMWLSGAQLYHYRARAYDPRLGRFMQTDPIGFAGGMNLYAYVSNDPLNFTDPLGLQEEPDVGPDIVVPGGRSPNNLADTYVVYLTDIAGMVQQGDVFVNRYGERLEITGEEEITITAQRCQTRECQRLRWEAGRSWRNRFAVSSLIEACQWTWCAGLPDPFGELRLLNRACGCFEEGTLVATPDGLRRIEDIEVGDQVFAWDPETGETGVQTVTALIRPEPKVLWRLDLRDADGEGEIFHVTDDHPWFVEGVGWVETQHLVAGQRIETADDRGLVIVGLSRTERIERTYNLTVDGPHTFLVGENGAVVHNNCWSAARQALEAMARADFRNGITLRDLRAINN